MSDHSRYEELAALDAGGFLSDAEQIELRQHTETCLDCRKAQTEFSELVHSGLPLMAIDEAADNMKTRPDDGMRMRFLQRATREGIGFSPDVERSTRRAGRRILFFVAAGAALAAAAVAVAFYGTYRQSSSWKLAQAQQQVDHLRQENSALIASQSRLNESIMAGQREMEDLRAQMNNLRRNNEQARGVAKQSSERAGQLLEESRDQEKLLAQARDEATRINQLRVNDEASLAEQQARLTELSYKLRVASATLDVERQLAAAGKDVRELMLARQLHVIDVRDTDQNGGASKAFGRVFVTEGKSLTFYAFDLDEDRAVNAKSSFQVWGVPETGKTTAVNLGNLQIDGRARGRWVLKVDNPQLVKEINSVFVTAEPTAAGKQPSGQKLLYAYLGEANHP